MVLADTGEDAVVDCARLRLRGEPREAPRVACPRGAADAEPRARREQVDTPGAAHHRGGRARSSGVAPTRLIKTLHLRRRRRAGRGAGPRRPRGERGQAQTARSARDEVAPGRRRDVIEQVTGAPGRLRRAGGAHERARSSPTATLAALAQRRHRRQRGRRAPAGTSTSARDFAVAACADLARRRSRRPLPALRQARSTIAPRHRGRARLQARHEVLRGAGARPSSTRTGKQQPHRHGLLRHRRQPHPRRRSSSRATTTNGIIWPVPLAPYEVHLVPLSNRRTPRPREAAERLVRGAARRAASRCSTTTATSARA